jgi:hypothetical protein
MKNSIRTSVSFLIVAAALVAPSMMPSQASAQDARCRPGDLFCAEVGVGPIEGHLRIGPADPPPVVVEPPPVVVVQPPTVYQPPPPVVVQPPTVIVQQPPPPSVVVVAQPPPREPPTVQVQVRRERRVVYDLVPDFDIGLRINVASMFADRGMGGLNAALRIRPERHVAIDVGTGIWYGNDYQAQERWEMPVQADLLVFLNPEHRFQVYLLVGGGMTFGGTGGRGGRDLMYAGGEAGIGAELRLSRFFALNLDVRGFLRQRVNGGPPEFQEQRADGLIYTTDTSGGFYGTLGMTFYFIGN